MHCYPQNNASVIIKIMCVCVCFIYSIYLNNIFFLEKSGKSEDGNDGTEDPLIGNRQRKDVLQNENAQVDQNKYVEELHESGEREIRKTPLKPPKCSETKISQDHMSESNDGETERDQAVGSLRAQQGESCTWKNEKGTSPHERGERKTETAPKVPLKPPKHSEVQFSDSAGDTDGREERDRDGDQTVEGSLLSHQGESSVSMEVDDEGETERRGRGETDITLSPMSSQPNQPNRPPVPPKPKDLTPPSPLDYSLPNKGWGTNITSLESADSPSMPPSDDTDQPQPESDRSENGTPV